MIDPVQDEAFLLAKGTGSKLSNLTRELWLCVKHGEKYRVVLDTARAARLKPDRYGKITAMQAQ